MDRPHIRQRYRRAARHSSRRSRFRYVQTSPPQSFCSFAYVAFAGLGTIKKLHFAAIRYSREITALYLAHTLRTLGMPSSRAHSRHTPAATDSGPLRVESDALRKAETDAWKARREQVEAELLALDDA